MTRTARLTTPGVLYQVASHLLDGRFLDSDDERERFLILFGRALERSDWRCVAYCLMSDQVCFAMIAGEQTLDTWARRVHGAFARWFNQKHGRRGPLFADRPSTHTVLGHRAANVIADIHNSPVRAGVANTPDAYVWSSHRAYLGSAAAPEWLRVDEGLARAGFPNQQSFSVFAGGARYEELPDPQARRTQARVRRRVLEIRAPIPVAVQIPHLIQQSTRVSPSVTALLVAVAERCGIPLAALQRRYAKGPASRAKRIAIHAAIGANISIAQVAAALNVTRQRGSAIGQVALAADEASVAREAAAVVGNRCHCPLRPCHHVER